MKKAVGFIIFAVLVIGGIVLYNLDSSNVKEKKEPKYCIKMVDEENKEIKYLCLGYALYREYNENQNEDIGSSKSLKFGIWFLEKENIIYDYE